MRFVVGNAALLGSLLLALGCSSSNSSSSAVPSIVITGPADGAMVVADASSPDVPIAFTVRDFTLKDPGTCAGAPACGHVEVFVDGAACNDPAPHPYNNAGAASPIDAGLDYCAALDGPHTITLALHNDDLSPVTDAAGATVSAAVMITARAGGGNDGGGTDGGAQDAGGSQCPGGGSPTATTSVTVKNNSFSPACISVSAGATVTWTNTGMASHTVTSDTGAPVSFDSGALGSGGHFAFTFADPGTVGYHCIPHAFLGMKGTVIVE